MKRLSVVIGIILVAITIFEVRATRIAASPAATRPRPATIQSREIAAEGRVVAYPGAEVTVGSDVAGTIRTLNVEEKDIVRKGQVIAVIKADDARAALAESRARVGEAEADIRLFESERERAQRLWREDVGSKQAADKAERDLDAARARRATANAEVTRLAAVVDKTEIVAPIDGVVISRFTHAGESIAVGAPVVTIADLKRTRVEAEIDEYDAARVDLGAHVGVTAEGYDGRTWSGTVEEIPDSVTSRRLKPQDPSKPIDTRVLLVKVALAEATPLKLGQRVEVRVAAK
ncbi:MAG: NolF secretion protein [Acidobacteria bacterium]|nr:NolF secretion protein [Acidobacteriota bacterium]